MDSPIIATLPAGHRMDRQFGVLFDHTPSYTDDLSQIEGIRAFEAALLNQQGVYCFGQIALWRHREMTGFASELQVPLARLIDEAWVPQARELCRQQMQPVRSGFPGTFFRTLTVIVCSLLAGVFAVWLLGQGKNKPLIGVLSADITSIQVPVSSKLSEVHVRAGDEVFSGQPLVTLENTQQLSQVEECQKRLHDSERELKRLEAQAALEMEWRRRDLDADIAGVREHLALLETPAFRGKSGLRSAAVRPRGTPATPASVRNSSSPKAANSSSGEILFFSGENKVTTEATTTVPDKQAASATKSTVPVQLVAVPVEDLSQAAAPIVSGNAQSIESPSEDAEKLRTELTRLEEVRSGLSSKIEDALGVTAAKECCTEFAEQLQSLRSTSAEVNLASPVYGIVGQVRGRCGDQLQSSEVVLRILHTDRRSVLVHLPTERVHEMSVGKEVELMFPGNQAFKGQVVEVPLMTETSSEESESRTVVRIEPIGKIWPSVPIGCQIEVISGR
jgi:multidrug resistance efflux pump